MAFEVEVTAAIGKRVSIRLREGEGFRDLLGVLQNENSLIKKDGTLAHFDHNQIAYFRVVPIFNRRDEIEDELVLYDTRSRTLRRIAEPGATVSIYCCGPTVYRDAHVGNMRTFLLADLAMRALHLSGHETTVVQNITDVGHMSDDIREEDKVLEESHRQSLSAIDIARKYEERFHQDLAALNIAPADHYPRASESMNLIIAAIERLVEKGSAYIGGDGNVYFDVHSFESYGAISGNKISELKPGHRYEYTGDGGKRFHADWALWKLARDRSEMVWDSPWGVGFPGWHIECTAMSLQLLGDEIDLHIGGIDLRFPHHENERAQTNSISGHEVVDHWLHGEHLLFEGKKMAKSSGNVLLVSDLNSAGLDPLSLRLVLLENRYRSQMDLTWDSLRAANTTLSKWRRVVTSWGSSEEVKFDREISDAFMNDLDTARAIIRLRAIEKDAAIGNPDKRAMFLYADQVLGLDLNRVTSSEISSAAQALLDARAAARKNGDWELSDRLRDQLAEMNIEVRDSKDGQSWELIN